MGWKNTNYQRMKTALDRMFTMMKYGQDEKIHENFGTSKLDEAMAVMKKNTDPLPHGWAQKLWNRFEKIK